MVHEKKVKKKKKFLTIQKHPHHTYVCRLKDVRYQLNNSSNAVAAIISENVVLPMLEFFSSGTPVVRSQYTQIYTYTQHYTYTHTGRKNQRDKYLYAEECEVWAPI